MSSADACGPSVEARVQELEVRSTFAERDLTELNAVVTAFTQRVERLEAELRQLRDLVSGTPVGDV